MLLNRTRTLLLGLIIAGGCLPMFGQESKAEEYYKYGNFLGALPLLLEEHRANALDPKLNEKIGYCYLMTNIDKKKAIPFLEMAANKMPKSNELKFELGQAYFHAHRFDDARKQFQAYRLEANASEAAVADKFMDFCKNAEKAIANPLPVEFINLGKKVNSEMDDFNPRVNYDEDALAFCTNRRYIADFSEYIHDVYIAQFVGKDWKRSQSISSKVNTSDHDYLAGVSPNLKQVLFRPDRVDEYDDIFVIECAEDGKYSYGAPLKYPEPVNQKATRELGACLSPSGDTLYFASDRAGGNGGTDIYYSIRIGNTWGQPVNAGTAINTPYDENYPQLNDAGNKLYFASEGHNSIGGFDVFVSQKKEDRQWNAPSNFGYPVNTTDDDFSISMSNRGRYGYVAAIRPEGLGGYDLYKVVFKDVEPFYQIFKGVIGVGTAEAVTPLDGTTSVQISVTNLANDAVFGEYKMNKTTGNYLISLPPASELRVKAAGYKLYKKAVTVPEVLPQRLVDKLDVLLEGEAGTVLPTPAVEKGKDTKPKGTSDTKTKPTTSPATKPATNPK